VLEDALIIAGGYLIGSIPFGVVVVRLLRGEDIRKHGSGNIGASNVWRTYGRWLGVPVALLDVAKGFLPALVGLEVGGEWVGMLAGFAAMLGHARPIWLGFTKGGKMVATGGGVAFALAPLAAGICLVVWLATFVLFRYASLASLVTAAALPIFCLLLGEPWPTVIFATIAGLAVIVLHRQNIRRLLHGTESRFSRGARASSA
jgi:glycerol-3-phosphate acyltransferase PlsY